MTIKADNGLLQDEPFAERLARRFHEVYETLAPFYDYETRRESAVEWEDVPENNRRLMVATCEQVQEELVGYLIEVLVRERERAERQ